MSYLVTGVRSEALQKNLAPPMHFVVGRKECLPLTVTYPEGYHLTTTGGELRVDAIEASPFPLSQDRQQLARFSPSFLDDHMWRCGLNCRSPRFGSKFQVRKFASSHGSGFKYSARKSLGVLFPNDRCGRNPLYSLRHCSSFSLVSSMLTN